MTTPDVQHCYLATCSEAYWNMKQ